MICLELPFPPAVNNITTVARGRKITTKRGRLYREQAVQAIRQQYRDRPLSGRLSVVLTLYPPCRRKRDIDNYSKASLDALTAAGVWEDDEQIDRLTIVRGDLLKGGGCSVEITRIRPVSA